MLVGRKIVSKICDKIQQHFNISQGIYGTPPIAKIHVDNSSEFLSNKKSQTASYATMRSMSSAEFLRMSSLFTSPDLESEPAIPETDDNVVVPKLLLGEKVV